MGQRILRDALNDAKKFNILNKFFGHTRWFQIILRDHLAYKNGYLQTKEKEEKMLEQQTNPYSAFIPEIWEQKLENMLRKNSPLRQCVNENYEGEIKNQGDSVRTIPNSDDASENIVVDQKKFFAFKINDVAQCQANQDIMEAHLQNAQRAIENVQDEYLLLQHQNVLEDNIVGFEESPMKLDKTTIYANFVNLALKLKNADTITTSQKPWVVINPTIESYLLQSTEFISAYNIADEILREGAIGRVAGMDVLVSTNLTAIGGKYYVLAGTNEAITFASQLAKIESLRDRDSFSDLVRGLYLYGAKTVQPKSLAKMIVAAG